MSTAAPSAQLASESHPEPFDAAISGLLLDTSAVPGEAGSADQPMPVRLYPEFGQEVTQAIELPDTKEAKAAAHAAFELLSWAFNQGADLP